MRHSRLTTLRNLLVVVTGLLILLTFAITVQAAVGDPCIANTEYVCDTETNQLTDELIPQPCVTNSEFVCDENGETTDIVVVDVPCTTDSAVTCGPDNETIAPPVEADPMPVAVVIDEISTPLVIEASVFYPATASRLAAMVG